MTEYLKNNPIALRHCLLYGFLQEKSIEKAFDDFCETVGHDVIDKEEFQFWFDLFEQGKFDEKEQPIADMKEVLRNDKQALRACVMYEWLTTKNMKLVNGALSPFTKYINFCKVIGDDVMGYRKFDIWFYRFENGMFDLKFEMDKDEKILELSDMPVDVMKNVVEYLDTFDRVSLAKTSRTFKTFVEDQKLFSKKLIFKLSSRTAWIYFENRKVVITKSGDTFYRSSENEHSQNKRLIKGVSHWKQGIQELVSILKYPKLHLEEFSFSLHIPDYFNKPTEGELEELDKSTQVLETAFKSLQQLHVKKLWLYTFNMNPLLNILPTLKPGYLSTIEIRIQKLEGDKMKEVVELEQWKQAKYFAMNWAESGTDFDVGSLSHFYHFKKFVVILNRFSVDDIREMKKFLQHKSIEKAFDDFCETVGHEVNNKETFQHWLDQFKQGKFDVKEQSVATKREVLRNDKQALRTCVMYEWLTTKNMKLVNGTLSSFTKYMNFCKVIGDDVMGYREFDIWFYRFENGKFDLNYEMDKDQKVLELSDMPLDIMKNVVEYLGIFDRVSLIKTSRSFKTFVEDQKAFSRTLQFGLNSRTAWIYFGNRRIGITKSGDDCYRSFENIHSQNKRLIKGVSHLKQGIQELETILKYPKLHLEEFSFSLRIWDDLNEPIEGKLEELDKATQALKAAFKPLQQLHVKKLLLATYNMNPLLYILPFLKPGYLSTIELYIHELNSNRMKEIVELEQWKQAKHFTMHRLHSESDFYVGPLSHFYHAKTFDVRCRTLSVEDIREIKKILFNSQDFKKCTIRLPFFFNMDTIKHEFGDFVQGTPNIYHYPIPNSTEFFEIETCFLVNTRGILITRMMK